MKKKTKKESDTSGVVDYTGIYSSFYDIFNSYILNQKYFDPSMALRETWNLYAQFLSLMNVFDNNPHMRKFEFEAAPLEKTYQDYLKMTSKNLNEIELEIRNWDRELV